MAVVVAVVVVVGVAVVVVGVVVGVGVVVESGCGRNSRHGGGVGAVRMRRKSTQNEKGILSPSSHQIVPVLPRCGVGLLKVTATYAYSRNPRMKFLALWGQK